MALKFCDSFDHYGTSDVLSKWTGFGASSVDFAIDTTHQRTGRACAQIKSNGIFKTIANRQTWIVGAAFQWQAFGGGIQFNDITTGQIALQSLGDGTFFVREAPPFGPVLGQTDPSAALNLGRYYYIEIKVKIAHAPNGTVEVRINGQVVLSLTGVDTQATGSASADVIQLLGPGGGNVVFVDDFYVADDTGASNNDFFGDTLIGVIMPRSDGDFLQWTPTPVGPHFSDVNEIPPDGDVSYVSDATVGDIDCYHFDLVDTTRTYRAIQTNITARKDDAANRALSILTRFGGNNFVADPGGRFVNETYIDYLNQFDVNPATGTAWTGTDINATQWGTKVIA